MTETTWEEDDMSETGYEDPDYETPKPLETGLESAPSPALPADISEPLTTDQARELTDTIRSTSEVLYVLLARAHAGKAWEALGYTSFAQYVREEFDMSRSRAYQVLDQARVISAIESAAPEGAELPTISEAAARDLKTIIGEVVPTIEQRTANLPAHEAGDVVEEIVEDYRDQVRDRREQDALEREEAEMDAAERRGFSDSSMGPNQPNMFVPPPPPSFDDDDPDDDFDPVMLRRTVQAAYDLYSSLSALKAMPDYELVINTIPAERRVQINESLPLARQWLAEFEASWWAQPWQNNQNSDNEDDVEELYDEDLYDEEV